MKVAKVIATCFTEKKNIEKTYLVGDPVGYFGHSQNCNTASDVIDLIKFNIKQEINCKPGIDRDLIIVNNNVGYDLGNKFIDEISGTKIPGGKIKCITRKNIGRSFGSYNQAFSKFRDEYDFFLFTEDDIIITKDNYFKIGIEILNKNPNNGFIAYIGITKVGSWHWKALGLNRETAFSCHGASGLTSTKILNKVFKKYGCLPYNKGSDRETDITYGEVAFPNSILQLGYELVDLPKNTILAVPAYDLMRGIEYKKWPTTLEKVFFLFKSNVYWLFSKSKFTLRLYLKLIKILKK
jgi:hypothetical protein